MKALISTIEPRETGFRVAQVETDANVFVVSDDFFWVDCTDDVVSDLFWYDPFDKTIKAIPEPEPVSQPISQGAQTL